jgi:uncharacterized protein (DUF2252 family)
MSIAEATTERQAPAARRSTAEPVHMTVADRVARGRAARVDVPRSSHAAFTPSSTRPDPIDLLEWQAARRIPQLVPIRYGRMLVSPFAFYRGAALLMAHDLAGTPRSGIQVQLCGDAHLSNFGVFASPERRLMFDINDFDETHPGPWEWDIKRLAASMAVAGRQNRYSGKQRRQILLTTVRTYRETMRMFSERTNLEVWYAHIDSEEIESVRARILGRVGRQRLATGLDKARSRDSMQVFTKLTGVVNGERRIIADPPLIIPIADLAPERERGELVAQIRHLFREYMRSLQSDRRALIEQFRLVDMAHKVVGVGSVGTRAWIVLFLGRDDNDPLFLQVKEAQPSVLAQFTGRGKYRHEGQRVVAGQRLMQATSDIFLGWQRAEGIDGRPRDFYVRQLRDWKGSVNVEQMMPRGMQLYGELCGRTLARAHARSGDRVAIAAYLGSGDVFDQAIADFAEAYADQNERDFDALAAAAASGRVRAETGL